MSLSRGMPVIPDAQEDESGASLQPVTLGKVGSLRLRSLPCQCAGFTQSLPGHGFRMFCVRVWLSVLLGCLVWFVHEGFRVLNIFISIFSR